MYKIYKLIIPNGKIYIGMTKQEKRYLRWDYGYGYPKNKKLTDDIFAFGWNNIEHEILEEVETKTEALLKEREYILKYQSNNPNFGYNDHSNKNTVRKKTKRYVRCIETGEIFESCEEAGRAIGKTKQSISYAITHNGKCNKCHWEFVRLQKDALT